MKTNKPITFENTQFNHSFDIEDWEITDIFKDTIWAEYIDETKEGDKLTKSGLHIPKSAERSMRDFLRIARVLKAGPDCSECVRPGKFILVPPNLGIQGIKKGPNGGKSVFLREETIMAVIEPKTNDAVYKKEEIYE